MTYNEIIKEYRDIKEQLRESFRAFVWEESNAVVFANDLDTAVSDIKKLVKKIRESEKINPQGDINEEGESEIEEN